LLRRGYVRQNPDTSRYFAGAKLATLAEGRSRYGELRLRARPLLRSLTESTRETANLVVLDDMQAVYIETVPSPQVVRLFTSIGNRTPLHATGAGKVLLANLATARRDVLIERLDLRGYTPRTITDRAVLRRALEDVREKGYAIDDEEYDEGLRCVAVAVAGAVGSGREATAGAPVGARADLVVYEYDGAVDTAMPDAVVLPESTADVSALARFCHEHAVPIVPRGAGTGLSGGAIPVEGGVVVSFARMARIVEIDAANLRAVVQPGVINLHLS